MGAGERMTEQERYKEIVKILETLAVLAERIIKNLVLFRDELRKEARGRIMEKELIKKILEDVKRWRESLEEMVLEEERKEAKFRDNNAKPE